MPQHKMGIETANAMSVVSYFGFESFDTFKAKVEAKTRAAKGGEGSGPVVVVRRQPKNSTSIPSHQTYFPLRYW